MIRGSFCNNSISFTSLTKTFFCLWAQNGAAEVCCATSTGHSPSHKPACSRPVFVGPCGRFCHLEAQIPVRLGLREIISASGRVGRAAASPGRGAPGRVCLTTSTCWSFFVLFCVFLLCFFPSFPPHFPPLPQERAGGRGLRGAAPLRSLQPRDGTGSGSPQASPGSPGPRRDAGNPA